jgi:hypothetical protein
MASQVIVGKPFVDHLRDHHTQAVTIADELLLSSAIVKTEILLIEVTEQVKRFDANVSSPQGSASSSSSNSPCGLCEPVPPRTFLRDPRSGGSNSCTNPNSPGSHRHAQPAARHLGGLSVLAALRRREALPLPITARRFPENCLHIKRESECFLVVSGNLSC